MKREAIISHLQSHKNYFNFTFILLTQLVFTFNVPRKAMLKHSISADINSDACKLLTLISGGALRGEPSVPRHSTLARSNRKPST